MIYKYYEEARTSYYEQLIYPTSLQNFTDLINRRQYDFSVFQTPLPVKFKMLEFGESQASVIKKMGRPRFVLENNKFSPTTFFYRETLLNHKLLIQLHFFDKKFIMATQSVIDTDVKWREIIKIIVLEKYGQEKPVITETHAGSGKNLVFADEAGNTIFFMDSINLNIVYSSGNARYLELVESFTDQKIKKMHEEQSQIKTILKNSF